MMLIGVIGGIVVFIALVILACYFLYKKHLRARSGVVLESP
jgi:hypothetical protein